VALVVSVSRAASVVSVESVALVVSVSPAVWVESVVSVVLVVSVNRAVWVESAASGASAVTVPRLCPQALETGRTTPYIAAVLLMRTGPRQIGLGAVLAVIRLADAKPAPGNRSPGKVEISLVSRPRAVGWVTLGAVPASAIEGEEPAEPIASAAGIFRALAQVTGMPSEEVPGDSTDPQRAATAAVAPRAWDLGAAASIVVAEDLGAAASIVVAEDLAAAASVVAVEVAEGAAVVEGKRHG
jgi:hypothetical protein